MAALASGMADLSQFVAFSTELFAGTRVSFKLM
jgi:hypothetical protein